MFSACYPDVPDAGCFLSSSAAFRRIPLDGFFAPLPISTCGNNFDDVFQSVDGSRHATAAEVCQVANNVVPYGIAALLGLLVQPCKDLAPVVSHLLVLLFVLLRRFLVAFVTYGIDSYFPLPSLEILINDAFLDVQRPQPAVSDRTTSRQP